MDNEETKQTVPEPIHDEGQYDPDLSKKIELKGHRWVQKGPYIECQSCPFKHGSYIGNEAMLAGYDDEGFPRFLKKH